MSGTPIERLPIDDATRAILAKAGIDTAEALSDLVLEGKVQTVKGIGAGRAAAIADAVSVWEADQTVPDHAGVIQAPDLPGAFEHDPEADDDGPDLAASNDDPAAGLDTSGPAPVVGPSEVRAPAQGATTFQGRGARYREVRVRVADVTPDTRQFWFVREGLAGQVVDAFEVVYVPASRTTPVRVYVYADDEARSKFVDHGGSNRFGHRELSVQAVVES